VQVQQNLFWYNSYHNTINQWTGAPLDPPTTSTPPTDTTLSPTDTTVLSTEATTTTTDTTTISANTTWSSMDTTVSLNDTTVSSSNTTVSLEDTTVSSSNTTVSLEDTTVSSSNTTVSEVTEPIRPVPTYPTFDFDNPTPSVIYRCPNKSGQPSYRSSLVFVVIVVSLAVTIIIVL